MGLEYGKNSFLSYYGISRKKYVRHESGRIIMKHINITKELHQHHFLFQLCVILNCYLVPVGWAGPGLYPQTIRWASASSLCAVWPGWRD
jgi:hypothetical protein